VKGLKNFSRLDESSLKYVDLNEGIESTLLILNNNIPHDLEIQKELGSIPHVECLGGKINQVFLNIINNSLQAISKNRPATPRLFISSEQREDHVLFTFEDNGPGMPEDVKKRIFEPFYTTKDIGEGTGLGLSISFNIIEAHKGRIKVESTPGEGTKFTVELPIESAMGETNSTSE
jgi:signal transduction histidine kinase